MNPSLHRVLYLAVLQGWWTGLYCCLSCTLASCGPLRCLWVQPPARRHSVSYRAGTGLAHAVPASVSALCLKSWRKDYLHCQDRLAACLLALWPAHTACLSPRTLSLILLPPPCLALTCTLLLLFCSLPRARPLPAAVQRRAQEPQQLHRQGDNLSAGTRRRRLAAAGSRCAALRLQPGSRQPEMIRPCCLPCCRQCAPSLRMHLHTYSHRQCGFLAFFISLPQKLQEEAAFFLLILSFTHLLLHICRAVCAAVWPHLEGVANLLEQYYHPSNSGRYAAARMYCRAVLPPRMVPAGPPCFAAVLPLPPSANHTCQLCSLALFGGCTVCTAVLDSYRTTSYTVPPNGTAGGLPRSPTSCASSPRTSASGWWRSTMPPLAPPTALTRVSQPFSTFSVSSWAH